MKYLTWTGMASLALLAIVCGANAAPLDTRDVLDAVRNKAVFCDGTYALCVRAPCLGIPTMDRPGNYSVDNAVCSCEVVTGWSMGPGSCTDRAPVTRNGRTYVISTYSNLFNSSHKTLTCSDAKTSWTWCYGAPCVVDDKDPTKATCTCPIMQGAMTTLGGDCRGDACQGIWSAATPAADQFANQHFYDYMRQNHPDVPAAAPANACPR